MVRLICPLLMLALVSAVALSKDIGLDRELAQARDLEQSGRYDEAAAVYRQILRSDPAAFPARVGLGRTCFHSHLYPDAVENFQSALRSSPQSSEVRRWLARSYLGNMQPEKAIEVLNEAAASTQSDTSALLLLARAYDAEDKIEDARRELRRALAVDPDCRGAHFALGYIAWSLHELSNAEAEFKLELALTTHEYLAFFYLAETLEIEGGFDDASTVLAKMAAENAHSYEYHLAAGKLNERMKNLARAADEFRTAISADSQRAEAHYHLAVTLRKLGDDRAAKLEFSRSTELREMASGMGQGMGRMRPRLPAFDFPLSGFSLAPK